MNSRPQLIGMKGMQLACRNTKTRSLCFFSLFAAVCTLLSVREHSANSRFVQFPELKSPFNNTLD